MKTSEIRLVVTLACAMGCAPGPGPLDVQADSVSRSSGGHRVGQLGGQCPDRRRIGVPTLGSCPAPGATTNGTWQRGTPFSSTYGALAFTSPVRAYCQYDWVSRSGAAPDLSALPSEDGRSPDVWLDRDCQVVAPLSAPTYHDVIGESLYSAYARQVELVPNLPVNPLLPERKTLVAIIDSTPGGLGFGSGTSPQGRFGHGYQVSRIVRDLACRDHDGTDPAVGCMAFADHPLALPRVDEFTVDYVHGGHFGSHGDLAQALYESIARYEYIRANVTPLDHMVINLSVGWLPELTGGSHDQPPAPVQAVLDILVEARCRGVLIVAAAGNDQGGTGDRTGLMYPAAWENETAVCNSGSHRPLLYAVGGVDGVDAPIVSGRVNGQPRLVAPADHAVVENRHTVVDPGYTEGLSGTSAAAAVASAAAAIAWGYAPALSAEEVGNLIYAAGIDLGVTADVCGASDCSTHRVSICETILAACASGGGSCPVPLPTCAPPIPYRDARPSGTYQGVGLAGLVDATFTPTPHVWAGPSLTTNPLCGGPTYGASPAPEYPCPFEQRAGTIARAWVDPQPDPASCPPCFIQEAEGNLTMYVEISKELPPTSVLHDVVLQLHTAAGVKFHELPPGAWMAGDVFKVTDIPMPGDPVVAVKMTYNVYGDAGTPYSGAESILYYGP